ncbi:MAG: insulinase family protein, partial [Lentisphaeria bacterium]|nr:insulinase family protein [Lentisphaeria bacterium]
MLTALEASSTYNVRQAVDRNGLTYTYVENDPFAGREYTLGNGLKVYLSRIALKPRIHFKMAVRAGIADSPEDATGLAHYFEHMMFKGTDRIGALDYKKEKPLLAKIEQLFEKYRKSSSEKEKALLYKQIDTLSGEAAKYASAGEYSALISMIGGSSLNASTSSDATLYVVDIPSGELERLLILESERMRNPVMRLFHTELEAVYEEYNRSCDNDTFLAHEALWSKLFYPHPYSWVPFIGKSVHLKNPSILRIKEFFRKYYVPSNMALTLAGDLDYDKTIALIRKYFSAFPAGEKVTRNLKKAQLLKKNEVVTVLSPRAGFQFIGFRLEKGRRNEILGYLLAQILSNGSAGLMDQNLVRAQKVAGAGAYCAERKDYSYFLLWGRPRAGQSFEALAALLLAELQKVKEGKFAPSLLKGILANYRRSLGEAQDD